VEYCQDLDYDGFRRLRLGCEIPLDANAMDRAVQRAGESDLALVFVGLTDEYDAEFQDRENMDLPGDQVELIKRVSQANPKTIVLLSSGSPVSMEEWIYKVPAILQTGYIGQEAGHAIADVLFGQVNPSGKLTETYPLRLEDNSAYINYPGENGKVLYGEGIFVGYRYYDMKKITPAFPFGHGLSYTSFRYDQLVIHTPEVKPGESAHLTVDISNKGEKQGKEVVQLYVRDVESNLIRPPKELKGFKKVNLEPGEKMTVSFELTPRDLSFYNPDQNEWVCEPGEFEVLIGSSSKDLPVRGSFFVR
jgi:beta-glucosidase